MTAICFDTETTGFNEDDEVLSLCIIGMNALGEEEIIFNEYFKPTRKIEWPEAERINHISPESTKNKKYITEYKKEIENILSDFDNWIGHNIDFDIRMLYQSGINIPNQAFITKWDTMKDYATLNKCKWPKLSELAKKYNFVFNAHDAEEDTKATVWCAKQMYKELFK